MSTVTISKKPVNINDVVILPRKEYAALLELKRIKEFSPTAMQKRALQQAETNLRKGKALSYNELVKKLGFTN